MKKLFLLALVLTPLILTSCGTDNDPEPNTKTLNKALLYDKLWLNESQSIDHKFDSDGTYGNGIGTWSWINESDTMLLQRNVGPNLKLVFNGGNSTDRCEIDFGPSGVYQEFRTSW